MSSSPVSLSLIRNSSGNKRRVVSQCEGPACGQYQVQEFWPYCSQSCGVRNFWAGVEVIENCIDQLDMPLRAFHHLDVILDECPFGDASEKLQQVIRHVRTAISTAQRDLAKSAVDFTHGTTAFTDALDVLIAGCDEQVRQANPNWTQHPDAWPAAQDPKWERGAMTGGFVQHWLSYHIFGAGELEMMVVYRSTWLRDSDNLYRPVEQILGDHSEVLYRELIQDEDMIFGQGELTVYALKRSNRPPGLHAGGNRG